jgi:Spherulation-specific family 4
MRLSKLATRRAKLLVSLIASTGLGVALAAGPAAAAFDVDDQRTLWPGYVYPWPAGEWYQFCDMARVGGDAASPGSIIIANVYDGPGLSADANYVAAIDYCQQRQHNVVGYVDTGHATRPLATVEAEIDAWFSFYPDLDGIFIDQMSNDPATKGYYREIYRYVHRAGTQGLLVANPGLPAESDWQLGSQPVADLLNVFEGDDEANPGYPGYLGWTPPAWMCDYSADNFSHLVYGVEPGDLAAVLAHSEDTGAGYRYVTDLRLPNPWRTLAYWPDQNQP